MYSNESIRFVFAGLILCILAVSDAEDIDSKYNIKGIF